jgi:GGDEF domain-containing protein
VADALALVERTLRNAARGTDIVTREGRGRFRIVMTSTGELAARAYLRRVRTTIEPGLESSDTPLRLVVATATVLDEPVEIAIRRATDRLSVAVETAASVGPGARAATPDDRPDDATTAPRAAAD